MICSPPYANTSPEKSSTGINIAKQWETYRSQGGGMSLAKFTAQQARHAEGYGSSEGQIANLPDKGLDGICTSPPYGASLDAGGPVGDSVKRARKGRKQVDTQYGGYKEPTPGQIGNDSGDSYWQAMATVYQQCLQALKPGGVLACVVKAYVKKGEIVPLPDQTWQLLLHLGFKPLARARAHLVKEHTTPGLFGTITERVARKSFFRRLAEQVKAATECWEELPAHNQLAATAATRELLDGDATDKQVLRAAQKANLAAWEATNGHWASETDIDWEDVLWVAKPRQPATTAAPAAVTPR